MGEGGEVVQVFAKAEADPRGKIRGKIDSVMAAIDIHSIQYARAAVKDFMAGLLGSTDVVFQQAPTSMVTILTSGYCRYMYLSSVHGFNISTRVSCIVLSTTNINWEVRKVRAPVVAAVYA